MIYTKVLRNYCLQNPGIVFDISNEYKGHFNMIPYHSYIKILHRLAEEGILIRYSRKAFLVAPNGNFDLDNIIFFYTCRNHGLSIGYKFYNEINVTDYKEKTIRILTDLIDTKTKTIGDYKLERLDLEDITENDICLIRLLELIQNRHNIIDRDDKKIDEMIEIYISSYSDIGFEKVIKARKYSFSTICTLDRLLKEYHIKENGCINIYNSIFLNNGSK